MRNFNPALKKIEAFIGAWGVKTGEIGGVEHLLELASRLFEIANSGIEERMAAEIEALGRKERKRLAQKNLAAVFGSVPRESAITPANGEITHEALTRMMDASKPHLIDGADLDVEGQLDIDPAKLLRKVVSAVISSGQAHILWEFPEVLAFFGARIPDREELGNHHNVDERMFEAKANWPNLKR